MKKYTVVRSEESYTDLRSIFRYISVDLWNHQAANNLHIKIMKRIDSLEVCPERYQLIDNENPRYAGLRVTHVDNYNIYYRVYDDEKVVKVYRVFYCGVNINSIAFEK